MELHEHKNWIIAQKTGEAQVLYSFDKPDFIFNKNEEKRAGKTILISDRTPTWRPIIVEFPTRINADTQVWFESKVKRDVNVRCLDMDGRVLEEWFIEGASPDSIITRPGRKIDTTVLYVTLNYRWSRRVR